MQLPPQSFSPVEHVTPELLLDELLLLLLDADDDELLLDEEEDDDELVLLLLDEDATTEEAAVDPPVARLDELERATAPPLPVLLAPLELLPDADDDANGTPPVWSAQPTGTRIAATAIESAVPARITA